MNQIPISKEKPEIADRLFMKFGAKWEDNIIIAYDGIIYCREDIWPQKIIHEKVHLDRQKEIGNEAWWRMYLESDSFRFDEEFLAYKAESDFVKRNIKDRNACFKIVRGMADDFASSIYGDIVTKDEAFKLLY